jgi:hypothetical protein
MRLTTYARAIGVVEGASEEELLAATRELVREARAARRDELERVVTAVRQFDSEEADRVDLDSAHLHVRAMERLREQGVVSPTESQYAAAVEAEELTVRGAGTAQTEPLPRAEPGEPLLRHHPDERVHRLAVQILRERHVMPDPETGLTDQASYDHAAEEAARELRQRGRNGAGS